MTWVLDQSQVKKGKSPFVTAQCNPLCVHPARGKVSEALLLLFYRVDVMYYPQTDRKSINIAHHSSFLNADQSHLTSFIVLTAGGWDE